MTKKVRHAEDNSPRVGDVGHLGPLEGVWQRQNGVGYYAFDVDLKEPSVEDLARALKEIDMRIKPEKPESFRRWLMSLFSSRKGHS